MQKKMIRIATFSFSVLLLFSIVIGTAKATTETLAIEPMQDISKRIKLTISESVSGKFLVSNGTIDFFVTDPDYSVLFSYNQTEYAQFNFTASKSGDYVMHLINSISPTKVLVEFTYGVNYVVVLQQDFKVWYNVGTWSTTLVTPPIQPPLDLLAILSALLTVLAIGEKITKGFRWLLGRLWWIWKYHKPRTPVVVNLPKSEKR